MRFSARRAREAILAAIAGAVALFAFNACTNHGGGSTDPGGNTVTVFASAGTTPTYTWSGPTAVSIDVARASAPSVGVWGISSPLNRDIASGAMHGVKPSDASETATTERVLTAGIKYRVTIALVDGTSGSVDFTP
jgi:hypothetical protein